MSVDLVKQSRRLTSALRRVRVQLEGSVRETEELNAELIRNGDLIEESKEMHSERLRTSLASSSRHLARVKDSARRERRGLIASLSFFSAVVVFVLVRRLRLVLLLPLLQSLFHTMSGLMSHTLRPQEMRRVEHQAETTPGGTERAKLVEEIMELERMMRELSREQGGLAELEVDELPYLESDQRSPHNGAGREVEIGLTGDDVIEAGEGEAATLESRSSHNVARREVEIGLTGDDVIEAE